MAVGTAPISPPIAVLLTLMVDHEVTPEVTLKAIGVNVTKVAKEAQARHNNKQARYFQP